MKTSIRIKSASLVLAIAAGFTLSTAGCKEAPPAAPANQQANVGVETTTVMSQQNIDSLDVPAHVMADPTKVVHIYPPLSGRIFGLRVLPGQEVGKGDVIAMLESSDVALARTDFQKAKIEVLRADRALARGKLLLQHDVLSQADYAELEATDEIAHSEVERARQRIHELGFDENGVSDQVALRAPISGAILDVGTATGEMQRSLDNATTIATIANLDTVWVSGDVFERDLSSLKTGSHVQVLVPAYPDTKLTGTIANISDALDPSTHTLKLRVVLVNKGHLLKPEMFATIRIEGASRRVYLLPETAVLHEGEKTSVFLLNSQGKFDQHPVQTGRTFDKAGVRQVEILSGLNDGDKVVTVGGALLRPVTGD
ncbi:efflux RND transporter periplasmic adaptor subunit [Granulicella sp. dw_53]|uniref:efflux RND transporter periplasmic adaptor subunit n=1 Tax=Granulicella sp. dw_53 TaxID=2719792 RepID=UPI001BD5C7DB|nr:efflux RND transporter periplasmic adaptor subunit [Granulicella sp. dw_53]